MVIKASIFLLSITSLPLMGGRPLQFGLRLYLVLLWYHAQDSLPIKNNLLVCSYPWSFRLPSELIWFLWGLIPCKDTILHICAAWLWVQWHQPILISTTNRQRRLGCFVLIFQKHLSTSFKALLNRIELIAFAAASSRIGVVLSFLVLTIIVEFLYMSLSRSILPLQRPSLAIILSISWYEDWTRNVPRSFKAAARLLLFGWD